MIVGTGIDIAEVPRIRHSIERFGDRFLRRIYTEGEIRYCDSKANRAERYAARFAAKEAAMKALGTGWNHGVRWRDCEVVRMPGGRPTIKFHGKAGEIAAKLGARNAALSISHTEEQAIAQVILEN
jgi:holo-[acyl-carrier protein] synthase